MSQKETTQVLPKKVIDWGHFKTVVIAVLFTAIIFTIVGYFLSINVIENSQTNWIQAMNSVSKTAK